MGEGGQGRGSKTVSDESPVKRARAALQDGNYKLSRTIAKSVLADASASAHDKEEARILLDATRIDVGPLVVGIVMFLVLAALFTFVLTRGHGG